MKLLISLTTGLWGALSLIATAAFAHGSQIVFEERPAVEITAMYGEGQPMVEAQVTVYSPDNLEEPWQTGMTDTAGQFAFVPDRDGAWEVKVRQAGHGAVVQIPVQMDAEVAAAQEPGDDPEAVVAPSQATVPPSSSYSPIQRGVMVLSVVWGCIGTALYFQRKTSA
jgi:nickel transport protein